MVGNAPVARSPMTLNGRCRRAARSWSRRASLVTPMNSCTEQPAYDRVMTSKGLRQAREKMEAAGVDELAIDVFAHYYRQLEHGETGMIAERRSTRWTWRRSPTSR